MKNNKIIFIIITLLLLGIVFVGVYSKMATTDTSKDNVINKNAKIEEIKKSEGKANIYFFWGNGCPHCKAEFEWIEEVNEKYPETFNLYGFEVWYNQNNASLVDNFAKAMGESLNGIPYMIIGDKSFIGFDESEENKQSMIDQILKAKDSDFDVYFDKVRLSN